MGNPCTDIEDIPYFQVHKICSDQCSLKLQVKDLERDIERTNLIFWMVIICFIIFMLGYFCGKMSECCKVQWKRFIKTQEMPV